MPEESFDEVDENDDTEAREERLELLAGSES